MHVHGVKVKPPPPGKYSPVPSSHFLHQLTSRREGAKRVTKRHLGNEVTFYFVSLLGFVLVLVVSSYTSINLDVCSDLTSKDYPEVHWRRLANVHWLVTVQEISGK